MPTNTDLVTDLPADFEVFGQAVDTSMAQLKGGTTGQILSKTSNTNMAFTWIDNQVGDITGVTAGTGITGGGTSGDVTVNFDVANYGGGQYAAGKNKIINGDFGIWQRGTSFTSPSSAYTADRFVANVLTSDVVSQQTFTPGTAPVSGYEGQYYARIATTATAGTRYLFQKVEDVRTLAGQTAAFSFWARVNSGTATIGAYFYQQFGSGGSVDVATSTQNFTATTSWQRFTYTTTMPSVSGKTIGAGSLVQAAVSFSATSNNIEFWGWQVEAGSTATPFQTATGTKQGELAACQRYYWRFGGDQTYQLMGQGIGFSTTRCYVPIKYPATMRVVPTSIDYSTLAVQRDPSQSIYSVTSLANLNGNGSGKDIFGLDVTVGSAVLSAGTPYCLITNGSTSAYLGFSAEL